MYAREAKHRQLLMAVLQDSSTNLLTIAVVCDAIAAEARFNTWFVANKDRGTVELMFDLVKEYEQLTDRCSEAIIAYQQDGDGETFRTGIELFTNELLRIMREKLPL